MVPVGEGGKGHRKALDWTRSNFKYSIAFETSAVANLEHRVKDRFFLIPFKLIIIIFGIQIKIHT